jgi:predicted dehydrogenase
LAFSQINVAVIGAGWVGGIRANACAGSALVDQLHIAEINPERAAEIAAETGAARVTDDWRVFLDDDTIDAIIIASTPESARFPIVRAALEAGKHVMVEKPIAPTPQEADEAIALADAGNLKLTVGYTRRFDPKYAYVNKAIKEGMIGEPVTSSATRSPAAASCRRRRWAAPIRSISCCGPCSRACRYGFIPSKPASCFPKSATRPTTNG